MVGNPSYCLKSREDIELSTAMLKLNKMASLLTPPPTPVIFSCQDPHLNTDSTLPFPLRQTSPSLPTEVLIEILERASVVDVHSCLSASSRLRLAAQMTLSPLKQELDQQGLEYVTHDATTEASAKELLRSLRSRKANWRNLSSDVRLTLPYPGPRTHFCIADGWLVSCHTIRSHDWVLEARTMPHTSPHLEHEHAVQRAVYEDWNHTILCDFAIDPSQDLAITAEFVDDKKTAQRGLFLRPLSLRSMTKHPKMSSGGDKWSASILLDRTLNTARPNLVISGDHVALYVGPLLIFNWKTGRTYVLPQPPAPESASHTFLSPTSLLFLYHGAQHRPMFFKLFRFVDGEDGLSGPKWIPAATFMLPPLSTDEDHHLNDVHIWATPSSLSTSKKNAANFTPRSREKIKDGDGIIVARFRGWDTTSDEGTAMLMVFPKSIFLKDLSSFEVAPQYPRRRNSTPPPPNLGESCSGRDKSSNHEGIMDSMIIPWHVWSPGNFRIIEDRMMVACRGVTSSCYGWRVAAMDTEDGKNGRISILDFNPRTVEWAVEEATADTHGKSSAAGTPVSDDRSVELNTNWNTLSMDRNASNAESKHIIPMVKKRVVTEATTLKRGILFNEDITSTLPFYEVMQSSPTADVRELRIDQDRLYVARIPTDDNPSGIDVHSF